MTKLSDIARELGVSTATISNALSGKGRMKDATRRHICEYARSMGYTPSSVPRKNLVLVITEMNQVSFTAMTLSGFTAAANEAEMLYAILDLNILSSGLTSGASPDALRPRISKALSAFPTKPACIVYISQYPRRLNSLLTDLGCPVVAVSCWNTGAQATINYDDQQGVNAAVSHLIQQGRQRIAMLSGPVDCHAVSERMIGYQRALIENGLAFHPKLVWIGDWEVPSGYELTRKLLDTSTKPDAIFSQNDSMAVGAMQAIAEAGLRIPEDIAVIGFDDTDFANWIRPALSSVEPPFHAMGRMAFQQAKALIEGTPVQENILLPCTLHVRQSVDKQA